MSEEVTLVPATRADEVLLENLLTLYIHDMSEIVPLVPDDDGRFRYRRLPPYFSEPTHFPFLIRRGDRTAGFAFATRGSPVSDDPAVLDVAEFFVLRGYRRFAVGRSAARLLWRRLPGEWTVHVFEGNRAGLPFWEATVREFTGGAFTAERHPDTPLPRRVFRFKSGDTT